MRGIVAVSKNNVMGINGKLPWYSPEDLKWFKQNTLKQTLIVGHETFKHIPLLLRNRKVFVITRDAGKSFEQYHQGDNKKLDDLIQHETFFTSKLDNLPSDSWVIGGYEIFELFIDKISDFHISHIPVDLKYSVDDDVTFFDHVVLDGFRNVGTTNKKTFYIQHYKRM